MTLPYLDLPVQSTLKVKLGVLDTRVMLIKCDNGQFFLDAHISSTNKSEIFFIIPIIRDRVIVGFIPTYAIIAYHC